MSFCTHSVLIPVALPEGCNPVCHFSVCSNSTQQKNKRDCLCLSLCMVNWNCKNFIFSTTTHIKSSLRCMSLLTFLRSSSIFCRFCFEERIHYYAQNTYVQQRSQQKKRWDISWLLALLIVTMMILQKYWTEVRGINSALLMFHIYYFTLIPFIPSKISHIYNIILLCPTTRCAPLIRCMSYLFTFHVCLVW